ncbi:MAG: hypothetical protein GX641_03105 [Mollicutes bacterium]|nr:hypothetical protein [Mollicutes bacterium]
MKKIKKIIAIILIIQMILISPLSVYFGVKNNVYAEPFVLTGLSMKFIATVCASLGILAFITENMDFEDFYNGFIEFVEDVKGVLDFQQDLISTIVNAIITSTKIEILTIVEYIKEYFNSIVEELVPEPDIVETYPGVKAIHNRNYEGQLDLIETNYIEVEIGNGYVLNYRLDYQTGIKFKFLANVQYNGTTVDGYSINKWLTDYPLGDKRTDDAKFMSKIQFSDESIIFDWILVNYKTNQMFEGNITEEIEPLIGLSDIPELSTGDEVTIPKIQSTPISLALPWDLDIDTEDVLGLDEDSFLEMINNESLENYLDRLLDLPKSVTDSIYPPDITIEDGEISGVEGTTWDDVLVEGKEHTTLLERIADRIDIISTDIKKFFNPDTTPDDDNGIDWGNFKNFFDIFWIFYYLIIIAILLLVKFLAVVMDILSIPANTALFDSYPTILQGINYIKGLKVGGFNITLQQIFEYMFMVFFFIYIVTTLQKLYHVFTGVERQELRHNQRDIQIDKTSFSNEIPSNIYNKKIYDNIIMRDPKGPDEEYMNLSDEEKFGRDG